MNKHEYSPGEDDYCVAMVAGVQCGLRRAAKCHRTVLPPTRDENNWRPRERQDF